MSESRVNQATIFLEGDGDETRGPLVRNLRGDGYRVAAALVTGALIWPDYGHLSRIFKWPALALFACVAAGG